jgi:hypothetical protein
LVLAVLAVQVLQMVATPYSVLLLLQVVARVAQTAALQVVVQVVVQVNLELLVLVHQVKVTMVVAAVIAALLL